VGFQRLFAAEPFVASGASVGFGVGLQVFFVVALRGEGFGTRFAVEPTLMVV